MPSGDVENPGPEAATTRASGAVTQSELDALLAAFEAKERRARQEAAPDGPPAPLNPTAQFASEANSAVVLSAAVPNSSDMDALIREVAPTAIALPPALEEPDIERGLEGFSAAVTGVAAAAVEPATNLLRNPEPSDTDELLAGDAPDASLADVPGDLMPSAQGAAVDGATVPTGAEHAELLNTGSDDMDEVLAAPFTDSVTQTSVIEEIGSENIAAGASPEFAAKGPAEIPAEAVGAQGQTTPAKAAKKVVPPAKDTPPPTKAPSPRRAWLPPSFLSLAREQPARAMAAMGVGLLAAVLAFAYLYANQLRPAEPAAGDPRAQMPLDRAVRTAEALMEEKDYAAAASLLGAALGRAEGEGEQVINAKFLHVQAMYLAAPDHLTTQEADLLHEAIDDVIAAGHEHPKTAEALMWKAGVYEREGNAAAARAELRGILDNYGSASNRDSVLLALAELELRTARRAEAIAAAERLLTDYPASPLTGRARLVQGDAYALGGNAKAARAVYLLAATERLDAATGTEAFERLGQLALDTGQPEAAIEELLKRLDTATTVKGNDVVYLVLARAYRAAKQPEKARNILNELIDFFPESKVMPAALVELSQVLDDLGLHAEAGRLTDRAAERYPANPDVLRRAGQMLADRGEPAGAGKKLIAAYDAGAHEPGVLLAAGGYLLEGGDAKEAQSAYTRLLEEHAAAPEALDAKIGWARAAREQGNLDAAYVRLQDLSRATEGGPRQLTALRALADLYRELGLEGELIETYGKVATVTNEAAPLAEAAERLFEAGAEDEGLQVAQRVDVSRLDPARAYGFLIAWGKTLLHKDADEALPVLMHAHEQFPAQRTAEGVETVFRVVLTLGRSAQARALVADLRNRVASPDHAAERPWFERAAVQYGDFLFRRGDYTEAADVYATVAPPVAAKDETPAGPAPAAEAKVEETEAQGWSRYQRANALYAVGNLAECLPLYDFVGGSGSRYAGDAKARAELVRFELRRRGEPDPVLPAKAAS